MRNKLKKEPKYKLGAVVEFNHKDSIFNGEIVGISEGLYAVSYCIYNTANSDHCDTFPMEDSDLATFTTYSNLFISNIGKRAFWKSEENIISIKSENNGTKCNKCKEFNKYINDANYVCWRCTNYPY